MNMFQFAKNRKNHRKEDDTNKVSNTNMNNNVNKRAPAGSPRRSTLSEIRMKRFRGLRSHSGGGASTSSSISAGTETELDPPNLLDSCDDDDTHNEDDTTASDTSGGIHQFSSLQLDVKLAQAKERRDEVQNKQKLQVLTKHEEAQKRVQQTLQDKQDKLRQDLDKKQRIRLRHSIRQHNRRKQIEEKFHSALDRAERYKNSKSKRKNDDDEDDSDEDYSHSSYDKRFQRAQSKRILVEFERRSQLLATLDFRSERATKNLESRLRHVQCKAREDIERAQSVARRVKAVRIIQRIVREQYGMTSRNNNALFSETKSQMNENAAALRLQNWYPWQTHVVAGRLGSDNTNNSVRNSLNFILTNMGLVVSSNDGTTTTPASFENLTAIITTQAMQKSAQCILEPLSPLFQSTIPSKKGKDDTQTNVRSSNIPCHRTLLSAFLIKIHPYEVLGEKRSSDKCTILLEKSSHKVVKLFLELADMMEAESKMKSSSSQMCNIIQNIASNVISYSTLFDLWKDGDLNEVVDGMVLSAVQTWVVFLTSKQALLYSDEKLKSLDESVKETFFQSRINYESAWNGAGSHLKLLRAALDKVIGKKEGFQVMRGAKQSAEQKINEGDMILAVRGEIDSILATDDEIASTIDTETNESESETESPAFEGEIPEHLFSNIEFVHKILLTDEEDMEESFLKVQNGSDTEIYDSPESFMADWRGKNSLEPSETEEIRDVASLQNRVARTMERAFFDNIEKDCIENKSLAGLHNLIHNLSDKMRSLVPNRPDLHSYFSKDDVEKCQSSGDVLMLLMKMAHILSNNLESPYRASSTNEWCQSAMLYHNAMGTAKNMSVPYSFNTLEAYLIASTVFLLKKTDLCQVEKVNFQLLQAVPLIRQRGHEYELKNFQEKHGSFEGALDLTATREWMEKSRSAFVNSPNELTAILRNNCFIDGLLFTNESIKMPEVLYLDGPLIQSVRTQARNTVIASALFLHGCNVNGIPAAQLSPYISQAMYHRERISTLILSNPSCDALLEALIDFSEGIGREVLDSEKVSALKRLVVAVLNGTDPVLKLLDSRMRNFFKFALKYLSNDNNISQNQAPSSMVTGRGTVNGTKDDPRALKKTKFLQQAEKEAKKAGFGIFSSNLIEATYEAHKAFDLCLQLYREDIFTPMANQYISE